MAKKAKVVTKIESTDTRTQIEIIAEANELLGNNKAPPPDDMVSELNATLRLYCDFFHESVPNLIYQTANDVELKKVNVKGDKEYLHFVSKRDGKKYRAKLGIPKPAILGVKEPLSIFEEEE